MTALTEASPARPRPLGVAVVLTGATAFAFSFFGYYTATVSGRTRATGAWHGFLGWFAALLALAAALVVAYPLVRRRSIGRWTYRVAFLSFAVATVCAVGALFTSGFDTAAVHALGVEADTGHGFGYWISLACLVAGAACSFGAARMSADGNTAD